MNKHEIDCEVIRDILPLYADDLASPPTRTLVDEHLEGCEPCGRALEQLQAEEAITPLSSDKALGRVKKQINKKRLLAALLSAAAACALAFLGFYFIMLPYAMRYNPKLFADELISLEETDTPGFNGPNEDFHGLHLVFRQGDNRHFIKEAGHIHMYRDCIMENDKEIHVVYMTWYRNGFEILHDIFVDSRGDDNCQKIPWHNAESDLPLVTRVYYYPHGDMDKLWEGEHGVFDGGNGWSQRTPVFERSHLIWEWDVETYGEPVDMVLEKDVPDRVFDIPADYTVVG